MCNVEHEGKQYSLPIVNSGNGPTLLGRSWLQHISLNWKQPFQPILKVDDQLTVTRVLQRRIQRRIRHSAR